MRKASRQFTSLLLALLLMLSLAAPALADGTLIVGEVTITASTTVNIRSGGSTDYPIIATGKSGQLFQTTGQAASGWYEILLPNNVMGYVSNRLVLFVPYPVPIPLGGAQQTTVPVYYRTQQGQQLRQVDVAVKTGQNVITADDSLVPGYRLVSTRSVYVTVDAMGKANPSGVIFLYEQNYVQPTPAPAITVTLPVYYMNQFNQIVASEYRPLSQGTQLVRADSTKLPWGYTLSGTTEAVVTVTSYGTASPNAVTFPVSQQAAATATPQIFSVPVSYRDEAGQILLNTSQVVNPGYTTVSANDSLVPAGMQLTSARSVVVYCSTTGVTFPSTVVFTYRSSVAATIQVVYQDNNGSSLYSEYRQLPQGSQTITADDSKVPAGYQLQGSRTAQVTVYSNGTVSQNRVVFVYARPVSLSLPVYYRDTQGNALFSENRALSQGTTTISADDSRVPAGYVLQSARNVQVTVYANGAASPSQVVFQYARPVSASVQVLYRDMGGSTLYSETRSFPQGTHTVTASDSRVPAGYVLQTTRNVQVTVYNNGSVSPSQVVFQYASPVSANVQIVYADNNGATLFSETRAYPQGSHTVTASDSRVPAGYTLLSARSVTVTVSANGSVNPGQVVFTYGPPAPPVTVNVPVIYKAQDGSILYQGSVSVSSDSPRNVSANKDRVPADYVLTSASSVTVRVSPDGTANPKEVVFTYRYRDPSAAVPAQMLPNFKTFSLSGGAQPVYSGPGTEYYRANDGRASVQSGRLRVWGFVGDWALIGYGLSNNLYRIGYISRGAVPNDVQVPELNLGSEVVQTVNLAPLNDDPIMSPIKIMEIPKGTDVILLGYLDDRWAYVETTLNGQPIRGFVRRHNISKP